MIKLAVVTTADKNFIKGFRRILDDIAKMYLTEYYNEITPKDGKIGELVFGTITKRGIFAYQIEPINEYTDMKYINIYINSANSKAGYTKSLMILKQTLRILSFEDKRATTVSLLDRANIKVNKKPHNKGGNKNVFNKKRR